jgi:hypothetical protein
MVLEPTTKQPDELRLVGPVDAGLLQHSKAQQIPDEGPRAVHHIQSRSTVGLRADTARQMALKGAESRFIDHRELSMIDLNKAPEMSSRAKVTATGPPRVATVAQLLGKTVNVLTRRPSPEPIECAVRLEIGL